LRSRWSAPNSCQSVKALNIEYRGQSLDSITSSFGVFKFKQDGQGPEDLIRAAEVALYRAKQEGRDCVVAAKPLAKVALPA
jgi:PleD family two-component response regulator